MIQEKVLWFQVAINEASIMKIVQRLYHAPCHKTGYVLIKTPVLLQDCEYISTQAGFH
jgi:hypothetical protein